LTTPTPITNDANETKPWLAPNIVAHAQFALYESFMFQSSISWFCFGSTATAQTRIST